jgi:hypothetical protein
MRWRPLTTLVAVAAAGALVWFVPHFDRTSSSGYWAAMALFAAAGLVLGIAQLHGRDGNPRATFFVVFVPVLIAAIWVLIGAQPGDDWFGRHVRSWSDDMGIAHAVHNLGEHAGVLAFAVGLIFGLTFEPHMIRRRRTAATAVVEPIAASSTAVTDVAPAGEPAVVEEAEPEREPEPQTESTETVAPTVTIPPR